MPNAPAGLSAGDVVTRGASLFVVYRVGDAGVALLRVVLQQSEGRSRADVRPAWSDLVDAGVPLADVVVRCVPIACRNADGLRRLGTVSSTLRGRLDRAVHRECAARRFEDTPPVRSTLHALEGGGSRGRQVGRQNAT